MRPWVSAAAATDMNAPIVCYVTDRQSLPRATGARPDQIAALLARIEQAARAGVDWIQLREKDLEGRPLFDLATKAMAVSAAARNVQTRGRILINDRLDVAWAAQSAGVHLGETSLPVSDVAQWRNQAGRADFLLGASCHSLDGAVQTAAGGADYIFFGPVFATPSKAAFGPPQGLQKLGQVCRAVSIPVLAIGGITPENAAACLAAGAAGIAAIRLFQDAQDLPGLLRQIRA
jgi:thiamine-phosphate pyrophosphorylase